MKRKQNPYPTNLSLSQLIQMKYDKQINDLNEKIKLLEERLNKLEEEKESNITPRIQLPLPRYGDFPYLSPASITPTLSAIKDFNNLMLRSNAESFDFGET